MMWTTQIQGGICIHELRVVCDPCTWSILCRRRCRETVWPNSRPGRILEMQRKFLNDARLSTFLSPSSGSSRPEARIGRRASRARSPRIAHCNRNLTTGNRVMYKDVRQRNKPRDGVERHEASPIAVRMLLKFLYEHMGCDGSLRYTRKAGLPSILTLCQVPARTFQPNMLDTLTLHPNSPQFSKRRNSQSLGLAIQT